ncbi:MAG: sugar transporter substrate-binding protein [Gemmataceae bacterium]|nr:sugar transporter substrate-binding protein [Gemmataceae bacterium]
MTRTPLTPDSGRGRTRVARVVRAVILLSAAGWAGGCVSAPGPAAEGIPVRRLPAEVFGRPKADLRTVPLTLLRQKEPDAYRVDKGDVLTVFAEDVLGVRNQIPVQVNPNPLAPKPAAQGYPVTVQDDGTIQVPEVPPIPVRGMTLTEVRAAVVKAITVDKKLIVPGKERVTVDLLQPRRYRVLVVREDGAAPPGEAAACGEGKKGAGYTLQLEAYHNDLLEALNRTGGLPGPCAKAEVVIRRDDPARGYVRVPLRTYPHEPVAFTDADIILTDGDTVYVEAREAETYSVVGGTGTAGGQFPLPRDADLRVVEALTRAACPAPACGMVTLVRQVGCGRQVPILVDLAEALRDSRENILVQPGDVIVLPGCKDCAAGKCKLHPVRPRIKLGPRPWPVAAGCDSCSADP